MTQDPIFAEAERLYMLANPHGCLAAEDETVKRYWMGKAAADGNVLDWHAPFAERVMARIHEYDDDWPKPHRDGTVVAFPGSKP